MTEVVRTPEEVRTRTGAWRADGERIGFVPTMGALHEGHAALLRKSVADCPRTVASIFVNPIQFGPGEDLDRYPRTFDDDRALCAREKVDLIFHPSAESMYPPGFETRVDQERLPMVLCGASRPGHFRGVMTVVLKLLHVVRPDLLYLGQKDFQQSVVLARMVRDLDLPVGVVTVPTVRERDGLALSSRNAYLGEEERRDALGLYHALLEAKRMVMGGETDAGRILAAMHEILGRIPSARSEYVTLVDPETLRPVDPLRKRTLATLAVRIGKTRLIDNMLLDRGGGPV